MEKSCEVCGKICSFRDDRPGRFCSRACHAAHKRMMSPYPCERNCKNCNKEFIVHTHHQKTKKFCSHSCAAKHNNQARKGIKYKRKGSHSFRNSVLEVFGHSCMVCGYDKFVDTHHVVKKSKGGKNNVGNGVVLCPNCHREAHGGLITTEQLLQIQAKALAGMAVGKLTCFENKYPSLRGIRGSIPLPAVE